MMGAVFCFYAANRLRFKNTLYLLTVAYRNPEKIHKKLGRGTSLVVPWLRLLLPVLRVQVQSLVKLLRSHMPQGQKTKT